MPIIDNSEPPFQIIAEGFKKDNIEIHNQNIYNQIIKPWQKKTLEFYGQKFFKALI